MHDEEFNAVPDPVILFDGVCNFCCATVKFVIRRDPNARFRFAPLQSDAARMLLKDAAERRVHLDSVLLIENGQIYRRSTASLRIYRNLNRLWPLLYAFIVIPAPLRDAVYDWVGRNRYRWFGKKESCWIPGPNLQDRFL